jgi:undecaprenyl-diphosphatase
MNKNINTLLLMLIALLACGAALTLLLSVPEVVSSDASLFITVNQQYGQSAAEAMRWIAAFGSLETGLLVFFALILLKRNDLASCVIVVLAIEIVTVMLWKELVARPRPYEAIANVHFLYTQLDFSFPSGHAAGAFALATVLGARVKKLLLPLAALASAVAFGRVYIGVHYPLDVLAGAVLGITIGYFVSRLDLSHLTGRLDALTARLKWHKV